jgi:hypothetical protein
MLNIRVVASDSRFDGDTGPRFIVAISIIDTTTREPSITFHPVCKYVSGPYISPPAITLAIISIVNITVNI